ncbi:MAG TPA: glutamyl-tRNA reductase [Longimicrobiales bacterium]|nr:glutamyl-tRNA reductase [Longimicrobiales bacterium]
MKLVGISHHTAPLHVRERFVFDNDQARALLRALLRDELASEAVLLSTCNRSELYYVAEEDNEPLHQVFVDELALRGQVAATDAEGFVYAHRERDVVHHLFRVTSSLDSMILGEPQIQGQVKAAFDVANELSAEARTAGPILTRLFESALSVGGRVRSQTDLGTGSASIPTAAVELARKIFGNLRGRTAAVVGSGEMSQLALECLHAEGVSDAVVVSRTEERARTVAEKMGARASAHADMPRLLADVDIIIAATAAPHAVITRELVQRSLPRGRRHPLLIVDIALPRDVEATVGDINNVFLYNIDDLQQVVDATLERRRSQVPAAERIIAEATEDFWSWFRSLEVVPLIRELRAHAEDIRQREVEKALRSMSNVSPSDAAAIEALTRQILAKVLHRPTVRLKEAASNGHEREVMRTMRYLLGLDEREERTK